MTPDVFSIHTWIASHDSIWDFKDINNPDDTPY